MPLDNVNILTEMVNYLLATTNVINILEALRIVIDLFTLQKRQTRTETITISQRIML